MIPHVMELNVICISFHWIVCIFTFIYYCVCMHVHVHACLCVCACTHVEVREDNFWVSSCLHPLLWGRVSPVSCYCTLRSYLMAFKLSVTSFSSASSLRRSIGIIDTTMDCIKFLTWIPETWTQVSGSRGKCFYILSRLLNPHAVIILRVVAHSVKLHRIKAFSLMWRIHRLYGAMPPFCVLLSLWDLFGHILIVLGFIIFR